MPTIMQATRIQPKRKRAEVKYYESDTSDAEASDASSIEDVVPTKRIKASKGKAVSTKPLPKKKVFPFMELPAELKNQIYELALKDENGIFLISKTKAYRRTVGRSTSEMSGALRRRRNRFHWYGDSPPPKPAITQPVGLVPRILLLNHDIHAEAQPILYGGNAFILEDTTAMYAFISNIGSKNSATLADLTIKGWGYTKAHKAMNHPAFTMLGSAVNLKHLHIDCRIHWSGDPRKIARQLFRDAHQYFEALGIAKGKTDAAVEIVEFPGENFGNRYLQTSMILTAEENLEVFRDEMRKLLRSH